MDIKISPFKLRVTLPYLPNTVGGFTLIEILVAIGILAILMALSISGYSSLNQRQTLLSAGQTMKNIIRDAQSRAYSGELDCSIGACDCTVGSASSLKGWYVDFVGKQIYGECQTALGPTITIMPKAFVLPTEVTVVPHATPPDRLLFQSYPPSADKQATVCLSQNGVTGNYSIYINNAGQISDNSVLVPTCP